MTRTITNTVSSSPLPHMMNNSQQHQQYQQQSNTSTTSSDTYQNLLQCLSFLYPQSNPTTTTPTFSNPSHMNTSIPTTSNTTISSTNPSLLNNLFTSRHQLVTSFESNANSTTSNNNFVLPVIPYTPSSSTNAISSSAVVIEEEIEEDNGCKSYRKRKTPNMSTLSHMITNNNSFNKSKKHKTRSDDLNSTHVEMIALDDTDDKIYDPSNSFFLLLKNHLEFNERLSKSLMKNKVVIDYTHSTSLCPAASLSQDFGKSPKAIDVYKQPIEKLCLLYSMYTHMCQKKGLSKDARSAYEKTRTLLKQVFDKYDNYYVAFTYCILSLYQSSEGDDESGKFYLDLVDHYFKYNKRNTGRKTDTQSDSTNEEAEINSLIKYVIPSADMDRDYFLQKFYYAAEVINEAGCQTRMTEIRKLLTCFYSYGTGMKEIVHPNFKGLLQKPIDSTTFETYLRMVDYTWEVSSLTSKSMNLEEDQRSILKHVGKGYKHTAYSLIITEYLDFLSKHVSPNACSSSINLETLKSDDEEVKKFLPQLYKELDDFMNLCKLEPESLGVMPPAYLSALSLACTIDLNLADTDPTILPKIERDLDVMYYMSRRYQKVKVVFSDLINQLLEKREELLVNKSTH